uniref:Uncharacterized protein n=1 Tax=Salmonella phage vB_SEnST11_KE23 TaxID=3161174 RepID=A0AAU8GIR8_9CAUD
MRPAWGACQYFLLHHMRKRAATSNGDRLAVCVVYIRDPRRLAVTVTTIDPQSNNGGAFHFSTLIGGVLDCFHHKAGDNLPAFTSRRGGAVVDHFSAVGFCSSTGKGARVEIVFHGVTSFVWLFCFACQCLVIVSQALTRVNNFLIFLSRRFPPLLNS